MPLLKHGSGFDGFDHGEIRIIQMRVLSDDRNGDLLFRLLVAFRSFDPLLHIRLHGNEIQLLRDDLRHAKRLEIDRNVINGVDGGRGDDGSALHPTEMADLIEEIIRNLEVRTRENHIRLETDPAKFADGELRRLGLKFFASHKVRKQREVHVKDVIPSHL